MFRRLMSLLLRADLKPILAWSGVDATKIVTQFSVEVPRLWSGTETLEQSLCRSDQQYVLYKRWLGSRRLCRVSFGQLLDGHQMRITESLPGPPPVYRL